MSEKEELPQVADETEKLQPYSEANVWDSLEPKHRMFAIAYAENQNLTQCANQFGVQQKTCRKWSRMPAVAALVNHQLEKYDDHSLINRQLLERSALDILDVAMGEEDTHGIDKDGGTYSHPVTNLPAANQALALMHRINHDTESRKIKAKEKSGSGATVIVNIEKANFSSNRHFDLLNQTQVIDHE